MNWQYLLDRFQLDDDLIRNYQVHLIAAIQMDALIVDREWNLALESYASNCKFPA